MSDYVSTLNEHRVKINQLMDDWAMSLISPISKERKNTKHLLVVQAIDDLRVWNLANPYEVGK